MKSAVMFCLAVGNWGRMIVKDLEDCVTTCDNDNKVQGSIVKMVFMLFLSPSFSL